MLMVRKLSMLEISLTIKLLVRWLLTPRFKKFRYTDRVVDLPRENGVWDLLFILTAINKLHVCLDNWDSYDHIISGVHYDKRSISEVCVVGLNKMWINNEIVSLHFTNPVDSTKILYKESLLMVLKHNIRVMKCSIDKNAFIMYQLKRHLNAVKGLV
jgi:hypothetical protein